MKKYEYRILRDSKENLIRIKKLIKTLKDNSEIYTIIDDNLIKK